MYGYGFIFVLKIPGCLFAFDEPVDRGVQRRGDTDALRFASDGSGEKIDFSRQLMADIVKHGGRVMGRGADPGHLPWIFMQANAGGLGHSLALIDSRMPHMPEVGSFAF